MTSIKKKRAFLIIIHTLAMLCYLYGHYLNSTQLFHGNECRMTYSHYRFVNVDVDASSGYGLWRFTDRRISVQIPNDSPTILFVPGHGASHLQARSIGAHGLGLTGQNMDIKFYNTSSINVYSLNFHEEPTGLHADLVKRQAKYCVEAIEKLKNEFHHDHVYIVAHSLGGLVARFALSQIEVRATITLATPHTILPYGFDKSMHVLYQQLKTTENNNPILSISGGIRDEQVPMMVQCSDSYDNSSAVLATDFNMNGVLGMDHKAIVWCHGVLRRVREFVLEMHSSNHTVAAMLAQNGTQYMESTRVLQDKFRSLFGYFQSTVMESSMYYHLEMLLGLYILVACLNDYALVVPLLAWLVSSRGLRFGSIVILTLVASTLYRVVNVLLQPRFFFPKLPVWCLPTLPFLIAGKLFVGRHAECLWVFLPFLMPSPPRGGRMMTMPLLLWFALQMLKMGKSYQVQDCIISVCVVEFLVVTYQKAQHHQKKQ